MLAKRLSIAQTISDYKKKNNLSVFQPEREKQMFKNYWNKAVEKKINPQLILQVFELVIDEMKEIQREMISNAK